MRDAPPRRSRVHPGHRHRARSSSARPASSTTPVPRPAGCCGEEGYRVILANSNPATIMTDPEFADRDLHRAADARGAGRHREPGTARRRAAHPRAARPRSTWPWPCTSGASSTRFGVEMIGANADAIAHRRGPRAIQGGHDRDRPGRAGIGVRLHPRRGGGGGRAHRLPVDHPALVHPGRRRHRHRPRRRRLGAAWPPSGWPPAPSPRS